MAINARIQGTGTNAFVQPGVGGTPAVPAVVLVDGSGNILKTTDNGDGTATLSSGITVEPAAVTTQVNFAASGVISGSPKDYRGFAVRETAGAVAVVRAWDNSAAASGTVLEEISLAPDESAREYYPDGGAKTTNGIYVQVVSGAVAGLIRVAV